MSFASETKKELTQVEADDYCMKAGSIRVNSYESFVIFC
ncbi:putative cell division protein WhiA OS=Lysinibacillus sphaericus OX=1421 GN=whiA PE=3 SV=1 [Lysinibacillus sphaericus]